ncbi:Unknown protein, partial [Striga hermonthica]
RADEDDRQSYASYASRASHDERRARRDDRERYHEGRRCHERRDEGRARYHERDDPRDDGASTQPKIVMPTFTGTDPDAWLSRAGQFFEINDLVREKYYPTYYRAEMEHQFLSLQQGTRTVDEFEREFTRLEAFVPDLVRTEAQRAQRFIDGLYPAVRHNIVGHGTQTYARAVSIAQEVDASIRREAVRDRAQPSAPVQPFIALPALPAAQPAKEKKRKGKGAQTDRRTRQRQQQVPPCPTCRRLHRGECHMGQDICYYCHEPGHFVSRRPKRLQQQPQQPQQPPQQQQPRQQAQRPPQQQQQRGRQQARVYAIDQVEAAQQPGTMSGMVVLNDIPVFALFDIGATHSFISRRCLDAIGVHAVTAVDPLEVSLASGRKIVTSAKASDLSLSIGGRVLSADAFVLEMRDFDLILGMDWLSFYHADIRCHDRDITLYLPRDESITFFGSRNRSLPH